MNKALKIKLKKKRCDITMTFSLVIFMQIKWVGCVRYVSE